MRARVQVGDFVAVSALLSEFEAQAAELARKEEEAVERMRAMEEQVGMEGQRRPVFQRGGMMALVCGGEGGTPLAYLQQQQQGVCACVR